MNGVESQKLNQIIAELSFDGMNEWKSFFLSPVFFFQKDRMNEWRLSFSLEKKKKQKNTQKIEKKNTSNFY